ncbi:SGNH/GDSL hydrolase family protein [Actinoplanes sp. NPDC051343]|uniref:SGNH/GDSL hydrolase family protein n=1 Tax=Actinoplanes sp. NPDC051343 TaxID=3363906 RepID=UPI00379F2E34
MKNKLITGCSAAALIAAGLYATVVSDPSEAATIRTTAWTGTWAVAPQSGGSSYSDQTLREVLHTSIGGSAARIHISNLFGSAPLRVNDVHLAVSAGSGTIVSGSDHTVAFGGVSSVTVPAGKSAISDAISMTVAAESDLAVSFYLPAPTGAATYHQLAKQNNYVASGDDSADTTLPSPSTIQSYDFLTNVDVQNSAAQGSVVAFGASLTDGFASTDGANRRWPNDLANRLTAADRTVGVINEGISGNNLLTGVNENPSGVSRFSRDVLQQPGVRWVVISDDPINDLGNADPPAEQLIAGLQQIIGLAHAAGVQVVCSTLTPFKDAYYWSAAGENGREAVNSWIRGSNSGCDHILDQDMVTHDPSNIQRYLPAYDSGDHLHPNDAGYQAIADAVDIAGIFG